MAEPLLETCNLDVGYGGQAVISGVNLSVEPGDILTLIGPNGAGKSTILKTLTRQLAPVAGMVRLEGVSLEEVSEKIIAQTMAILMTERSRPELMTCWEVVSAGRYPYTGSLGILSAEDREEVSQAMDLVGVSSLAERDFTRISDGQRQLVMLARAICQQPRLLVLDEPTSFLDIRHKLILLAILKNLVKERSLAVVMSLHELDLAQRVSDTVVCVRGGKIDRMGTPDEVFSGGYIQQLYDVVAGSYNEVFGSPELAAPTGPVQVFVIGGNGSGIAMYRQLQRLGIPFVVGILFENDVDIPVAQALAANVITARPFQPIDEETLERATQALDECTQVICCLDNFGPFNEANRHLREYAQLKGLLVSVDTFLRRSETTEGSLPHDPRLVSCADAICSEGGGA